MLNIINSIPYLNHNKFNLLKVEALQSKLEAGEEVLRRTDSCNTERVNYDHYINIARLWYNVITI